MSWFQLDPESVAARVQSSGRPADLPSLGDSLRRGIVGFTAVSVGGFLPWAVFGRWSYRHIGEAGLYAVCAFIFVSLAGPMMHRLIIGPGSLSRFWKLFALSFGAYSVAWIGGWMSLRGHPGSVAGLLAGTSVMGVMLALAFDARRETLRIIASLFVLNALGYFAGGWVEAVGTQMELTSLEKSTRVLITKLMWGVSYGIGFGAGLGLAFHLCQAKTRARINAASTSSGDVTLRARARSRSDQESATTPPPDS